MKKYLFIALLILICSLSFTQVQWQERGIPIRQGENIKWNQTSIACSDEIFVSVWTDTRDGVRGVYAQKTDLDGNLLWGENGLEVYHSNTMQDHPIAISSDSNSIIICWKDYDFVESHLFQIRIQKIDADGNLLWGNDGNLLNNIEPDWHVPKLFNHSDGGVYYIWREGVYQDRDIYGLRLLADGSIADGWETGMQILTATGEYDVHPDGSDGLIIASVLDDDIYIQRIDEDGEKYWGYNGTLLYNGDEYISEINICSSTNDELFFSWRTDVVGEFDKVMLDKTDFSGNIVWNSPVIISDNSHTHKLKSICPNDSRPILMWNNNDTIFAQKIDTDGSSLWGDEGIEIYEFNDFYDNLSFDLKAGTSSDCYFRWVDNINNMYEIGIQRINDAGNLLFGEDGIIIFEGPSAYPSLSISEQATYLCWMHYSDGHQFLSHQLIDENGNLFLEENGEEIITGLTGSVYDFQMLENSDNPIFIWSERRDGQNYKIYQQVLDVDGSCILSENGIPITTNSSNDQRDLNAVYGENSGTIAAVWSEYNEGLVQILTQGIDTSGNFLWSDSTGVILSSLDYDSRYPAISYVNNSGIDEYYIGWESHVDLINPAIVGQKIINGEQQWQEDGIIIAEPESFAVSLIDVIDRFYIWNDYDLYDASLKIKLVDENGVTALGWPDDGLEIVNDISNDDVQVKLISSGVFIIWQDDENGIYGQIVDYDGNTFWAEGGIQLISEDYIYNYDILYEDYIYIIWNDDRDDVYKNFYMQKFNNEGEALWQESGVQISSHNYNSHGKPILTSIEQNIFAVWEHSFESSSSLIKAQLVSPNGELHYNIPGLTICHQFMDQKHQQVYINGTNAYVSWMDSRSGEEEEEDCGSTIDGLYAQKVHLDATFADDELVEPFEILSNYPNPFNPETTISFSLTTESTQNTEINIFNIKGQKIKQLEIRNLKLGINEVIWNGTDKNNQPVASGIYFYQLNIDDKIIASKKCLLLK